MRRLFSILLLLIFSFNIYLPESTIRAAGSVQENKTVTLKLKWQHQFQFAGYYAALEKGYYADVGLNVIIEPATNYAEPLDSVLRGEAQFGIGASDLILSRARGVPVVAMAAIFQHSPSVLLVRSDGKITNVHDLVNKKLMLEQHSDELLAYLKSEGVFLDRINVYTHEFDPNALIQNRVDAISAYVSDEPFLLDQAGVSYQIYSPRSAGIDFYADILFTTEDTIEQDSEMVAAFRSASLKGWEYAMKNEDEIIDLIYEKYSQRHTREHLKFEAEKMRDLVIPKNVNIGQMYSGRWEHIANTYADLGMLSANHNLTGFLYKDPRPATRWLILALVSLSLILVLLLLQGFAYTLKQAIQSFHRLCKRH